MNNALKPVSAAEANAMWRNDAPVMWSDIQVPKWESNRTAWLLTCVDLTSLLVGFFVLFFSTQTLEKSQWEALNGGFQARFAPQATVVEVVPDGTTNGEVRPQVQTSGLAYLDTLLRQRMQSDAVWSRLAAEGAPAEATRDLRYVIPAEAMGAGGDETWGRLGGALRGWKNPLGIGVVARTADAGKAAQLAVDLAAKLSRAGIAHAFADVKIDEAAAEPVAQLVVRAR